MGASSVTWNEETEQHMDMRARLLTRNDDYIFDTVCVQPTSVPFSLQLHTPPSNAVEHSHALEDVHRPRSTILFFATSIRSQDGKAKKDFGARHQNGQDDEHNDDPRDSRHLHIGNAVG